MGYLVNELRRMYPHIANQSSEELRDGITDHVIGFCEEALDVLEQGFEVPQDCPVKLNEENVEMLKNFYKTGKRVAEELRGTPGNIASPLLMLLSLVLKRPNVAKQIAELMGEYFAADLFRMHMETMNQANNSTKH